MKKRILAMLLVLAMVLSLTPTFALATDSGTGPETGTGTEATTFVAKIGDTGYATFAEAITAANAMTGNVEVEIYGKVEYTAETADLTGAYDSISFVGKTNNAEISITRNGSGGYISGSNQGNDCTVNFTDLILSKPTGEYVSDAGFMNVYFTVYRVGAVNYTNCTFPDGACAQGCPVNYTNCTFANMTSGEYSLWVYANTTTTVNNGTFSGVRGAKMYGENAAKTGNLVLKNSKFTESVTQKPAIALTYGQSVTLEGNTYPTKGVFELDKDGAPNGTTVTSTDVITCTNDDGVCGVLVDGKIYTTITDAAAVATSGSTVTLLYDTEETVELAEGVTLNKNGHTADNVTVPVMVAQVGDKQYTSLAEALSAETTVAGNTVTLLTDIEASGVVTINKAITLDLNGYSISREGAADNSTVLYVTTADVTVTDSAKTNGAGVVNTNAGMAIWVAANAGLTLTDVNVTGSDYAVLAQKDSSLTVGDSAVVKGTNTTSECGDGIRAYSAKVVVNGKIEAGAVGTAIELYGSTNVTMNGTIVAEDYAMQVYGGTATVNGNITAKTAFFMSNDNEETANVNNGTVTVTGGNIAAVTNVVMNNAKEAANFAPVVSITGGTFSVDPAAYVADGYVATYASGKYTVAARAEDEEEVTVDTSVSATTGNATVDTNVTDTNVTDNISSVTTNTQTKSDLQDAAYNLQNDTTVVGTAQEATNKLQENEVTVDENTVVTVEVQPYLDVHVEDISTTTEGEGEEVTTTTVMTVEITPKYNVVAVATKDDTTVGTATIKEAQEMTVTEPVTITIPLPKDFVTSESDKVYVHHYKDNGDRYMYEAAVTKNGDVYYATFTNPNGFSTFEISRSTTASVPEPIKVGYNLTLESYIDFSFFMYKTDVPEGATVTITRNGTAKEITAESYNTTMWRFRYADVAPAEYLDTLTLTVKDSAGNVIVEETQSIKSYAEARVDKAESDAAMMQALLNYCAACDAYFPVK